MTWKEFVEKVADPGQVVFVDGNPVWDFKFESDRLYLISEPVEGSDDYERVTAAEISENVGLFDEIDLFSETDRTAITENQITCN